MNYPYKHNNAPGTLNHTIKQWQRVERRQWSRERVKNELATWSFTALIALIIVAAIVGAVDRLP